MIWQNNNSNLIKFIEDLNAVHPNTKFTVELENENKMRFLDILVKRCNGLVTSVYHKPTHTSGYIIKNHTIARAES